MSASKPELVLLFIRNLVRKNTKNSILYKYFETILFY